MSGEAGIGVDYCVDVGGEVAFEFREYVAGGTGTCPDIVDEDCEVEVFNFGFDVFYLLIRRGSIETGVTDDGFYFYTGEFVEQEGAD